MRRCGSMGTDGPSHVGPLEDLEMAEAVTLYSTKEPKEGAVDNATLKSSVAKILTDMQLGKDKPEDSKVKGTAHLAYDREAHVFTLVTDGMTKRDTTALMKKVAEFRTPEAEAAWAADRAEMASKTEMVREAARAREATTQEPGPARERREKEQAQIDAGATRYTMYRTDLPAEKAQFVELLKEIGATSHYNGKAKDAENKPHPHFTVVTSAPDVEQKFAHFMGDAARERMYARGAERDAERGADRPAAQAKETLREEVARRGAAFMGRYGKGLKLYENSKGDWTDSAANATAEQVTRVRNETAKLRDALLDKEVTLRAEQSGMSKSQLKELAGAGNFRELSKHGTGLEPRDRTELQALSRGVRALDKFLTDVKGVVSKESRKPAQGANRAAETGKDQSQDQSKTRSAAKGTPRDVASQDAAADAVAAVFAGRRRGTGR